MRTDRAGQTSLAGTCRITGREGEGDTNNGAETQQLIHRPKLPNQDGPVPSGLLDVISFWKLETTDASKGKEHRLGKKS